MSQHESENLYRAVFPDGEHLAPSRDTDGAFRGATLDDETNQLKGQAEFIPVEPSEDTEDDGERWSYDGEPSPDMTAVLMAAAIGIAAGIIATLVVQNTPRIIAWWRDQFLPSIRERWNTLLSAMRPDQLGRVMGALAVPVHTDAVEFSAQVSRAVTDDRISMSSDEAKRRFLAMFMAAAVAAEQVRVLGAARIRRDANFAALERTMAQLSTPAVLETVNRMLVSDAHLLDAPARDALTALFVPTGVGDEGAALQLESLQAALSLVGEQRP